MAKTYDVGQEVRVEARFTSDGDRNSPAADPATLALRWRAPDGTVEDFAIGDLENPEVGRYFILLTLDTPGVYVANWTATDADKVGNNEQVFTAAPVGIDGYLLAFYGAFPGGRGASEDDDYIAPSPRDQVRLLVGDTDSAAFLLRDAEVDWLLARANSDVTATAVQAALAIAAKLSRDVDRSLGDVSRSASQRSSAYRELARALSDQVALDRANERVDAVPLALAGGIDDDPYFSMGFMDPPGTTRPWGSGTDARAGC